MISIIIPTFNRAKTLEQTIQSFIRQKTNHPIEIIVADNNSTDLTPQLIERIRPNTSIPLVYFREPRQGVHFARNAAAKKASGEILYFTDDDMVADEGLIENLASVFETNNRIATATGKVLPLWEASPPDWILTYCNNGWLSLADYGDKEFITDDDPGIWSCHQAIRKNVFFESGGFNPENTGGNWIGDGETGLNIKIRKLGYQFAYSPGSVTYHIIPQSRLTQAYLNKRLANQGNCDTYTEYRASPSNSASLILSSVLDFLRIPKFYIRSVLQKWNNNDQWHMTRAWSHYFRSKCKYKFRLATDGLFRAMVLKNDWLKDA